MPTSERITVSILDGATQAKFDEHQIVTTATKTECWIESKEDLQFSIKLDLAPASLETRNGFSCRIIVDGILVRQPLLSAWGGASWAERIVTGAWHNEKTRPLMFAKTLFKEEGQMDKKLLENMGTIQVKVCRVKIGQRSIDQFHGLTGTLTSKGVTEKAKKALITHSVGYGKPVEEPAPIYWDVTPIDAWDTPLHTFIFKYQILEAMDIIPSAPIPHDELEDSASLTPSSDEEDEDEGIDLTEKIKRLKNELRQFKRKVKEEPRTSPELVDLTQPEAKKRKVVIDLTA